jgi:hypothetical protein
VWQGGHRFEGVAGPDVLLDGDPEDSAAVDALFVELAKEVSNDPAGA